MDSVVEWLALVMSVLAVMYVAWTLLDPRRF